MSEAVSRPVLRVAVVLLLCWLAGCTKARDKIQRMNDLKIIGLAYQNHYDSTMKGPSKPEDLGPYMENDQRLLGKLRSGEVVFIYDVAIKDLTKAGLKTGDVILAYEKDAPTRGGHVLYADGVVKEVTADEFKSARLAQPKQ